ncbi:beta-propeller fold lactonase family protein [Bacillus aerolatus]|uniref:Beta-propeller fold lactonase family protein n=1 Tax=Bacillus aerolatus TaxID=2653354 RepID=A0A6I1FJK3_9BACI|nr:lactonase family protein [Bacillus aerolatus]KAB7706179.1 beta-propeller fold lactonase family protein [Bacillus aerolatus]
MTNNNKFIGYVGTYTKGDSKGIYTFTLDTETAKITDVKAAATLDNPTYLTISQDNRYLYAVVKEGSKGGIAAYSINNQTGELEALNRQLLEGASPCHVSVNRENLTAVTANYHKGTIESYAVDQEKGTVSPVSSIMEHEGSGPNKERQEKPHAHYAGFSPDEKYVLAVDLGIDQLITYQVNKGILSEANRLFANPGSGPRHLVFHPNGKYAYVMTELSSEVISLIYNPEDGSFTELQYTPTIPADFSENNQGSAIHISSDGRFVYAANRGHDSIAVFSVNQDSGELTFVELTSTEGNWPRDFILDPTGKFLVASNQESGNLVLFSRDESTGKLTLLQSDVSVPDPVCVKFLNV